VQKLAFDHTNAVHGQNGQKIDMRDPKIRQIQRLSLQKSSFFADFGSIVTLRQQ
jgi:hypothetical protein